MERSWTVVFDGEVLRPAGPVDLEPNRSDLVTILPPDKIEGRTDAANRETAWDVRD